MSDTTKPEITVADLRYGQFDVIERTIHRALLETDFRPPLRICFHAGGRTIELPWPLRPGEETPRRRLARFGVGQDPLDDATPVTVTIVPKTAITSACPACGRSIAVNLVPPPDNTDKVNLDLRTVELRHSPRDQVLSALQRYWRWCGEGRRPYAVEGESSLGGAPAQYYYDGHMDFISYDQDNNLYHFHLQAVPNWRVDQVGTIQHTGKEWEVVFRTD
jgi:hypothetical protein